MKNNNTLDERILLERREIQSAAYVWVVAGLLVSIIVQQFFMNAPFAQFAAEFFILICCGLYSIISNFIKGIDIWNPAGIGKKRLFLNTIASGIAAVILLAFLSGNNDVKSLTLHFVTFVVFFFVFQLIMISLNNKKQLSIEKKVNEDEENA